MTKNLDKEGLRSIVDDYQLFYVDLWGVVHNGVFLHKEAIKALNELTKKKKDFILLTNAPRPNHSVKSFLERLGMEKKMRDHVFTSGEAALNYLKKNFLNEIFYHIGPSRDFDLFNDFEKNESDNIEKCDYLLCTGLFDDHEDDLKYLDASFSIIPIPLGFGSALIDLFKNALNGLFRVEDTLNDIVSPGRAESLSE